MTDRELLELAAKTAGFGAPGSGAVCWTESEYPRRSGKFGALWNYVGHMDTAELWNPLSDDGDALRLAVKVLNWPHGGHAFDNAVAAMHAVGHLPTDPYTATRRAIVQAAVIIGKGMK